MILFNHETRHTQILIPLHSVLILLLRFHLEFLRRLSLDLSGSQLPLWEEPGNGHVSERRTRTAKIVRRIHERNRLFQ